MKLERIYNRKDQQTRVGCLKRLIKVTSHNWDWSWKTKGTNE